MKDEMIRNTILMLLILLLMASCVGVDGAPLTLGDGEQSMTEVAPPAGKLPPHSSAAPEDSHLLEALAYSPANVQHLLFTDWTLVHDAMGVDRTYDTITDEWMLALNREHVTASVYAGFRQRDHTAEWGWDALDLEWEMLLSGDLPPTYVLKLHSDFDFAPVVDRFEERGFTRQEYRGVPVYSHPMDLGLDWVRTTELAILNVALLEDEGLLVLASTPNGVQAVLKARAQGANLFEDTAAQAVAQRLAGASAVVLMPGPDTCLSFTPNPLLDALGKGEITPEELLDGQLPAQPQAIYLALGLGYRYPGAGRAGENAALLDAVDVPHWLVVMHYPTPELAMLDLAPRLTLAEKGMSQVADNPYSELYRVEANSVAGQDLLLALAPVGERRLSLLLSMFNRRDLLFATCP